jgi:hypothetical protein
MTYEFGDGRLMVNGVDISRLDSCIVAAPNSALRPGWRDFTSAEILRDVNAALAASSRGEIRFSASVLISYPQWMELMRFITRERRKLLIHSRSLKPRRWRRGREVVA